jgi:maltokinase
MSAVDTVELTRLVQDWLPTQRWFASKGRDAEVRLELVDELSADVDLWFVHVDLTDGAHEVYQLPLVVHGEPQPSLDQVLIGSIDSSVDADGTNLSWVYDALHDKDATGLWLTAIRDEQTSGRPNFRRYAEIEAIPVGEPSTVLGGEQSNTSLVFGDAAILKVFRRLRLGSNPDIEIGEALGALGSRNTPRLLGAVSADGYALAMLQEYMTTGVDGWELAKASVRDLMAEADLHAEEAGGDFAGEAHRLGTTVAQMHADLAAAFGPSSDVDVRERSREMIRRLELALPVVPALSAVEDAVRALFDNFARLETTLPTQRIHGDLHLGQALRTSQRWVVIDFEGEPMAELDERRRPDSVLRDVAGILRSFDYAGHHRMIEVAAHPQLTYRAAEWAERNGSAFCDGYAETAGFDPREQSVALRAYEAEKAIYESVYEVRHRPDWLPIPLETLHRLTEASS